MSDPDDFRIIRKSRPYDGRFLKVDEVEFEFRKSNGAMSDPQKHEIAERGDSVAILAYDTDRGLLALVQQFRVAAALNKERQTWILELPAGRIEPGETPKAAARRELREETGYNLFRYVRNENHDQLGRFQNIGTYYASVGGSTERIHFFFVPVTSDDFVAHGTLGGGGTGEDVKLVLMPPDELFRSLDAGEPCDAKLAIAAQWLRRSGVPRREDAKHYEQVAFSFSADGEFKNEAGPFIGFKIGDISNVQDVDIWINSENTDLSMDRFFGTSVSSRIRYLGADKLANGSIHRDTIANSLRAKLKGDFFVKAGTCHRTKPGKLKEPPYRVRHILHAAAVQGFPGRPLYADPNTSAACVTDALRMAKEEINDRLWPGQSPCRSILVPMLGAGQGGLRPSAIAAAIVPPVIDFLRQNPNSPLNCIYFLALTAGDYHLIRQQLEPYTRGASAQLREFKFAPSKRTIT